MTSDDTTLDASAPWLEVDALIDDPHTRIVVCCGSGGVGKTTTAAALGVRAAERGRKVVVLTIDPARRLAQSMGISELDNVPRQVKGVDDAAGGELHAMMLDMKRTFDEIVEGHADADRARAILENPFYQSLSAGFAGTQEYMAMEKLGQLRAGDEWDLVVVDTPPSRSALDFLDAPKRLGSFLDGKFIRVLMAPAKVGGRAGMKFLNVGMSMMTGTLSKLMGGQLLRDVQTFVAAMDTMFGGFRTRADATYRLLQAPGTAFLVVAAPERDALREAAYFVERLAAEQMPLAGLVLNRVHGSGAAQLSAERALAAAEILTDHGAEDAGADEARATGADGAQETDAHETRATGTGDARDGSADDARDADAENLASAGIVDLDGGKAATGTAGGLSPAAAAEHVASPSASAAQLAAGLLRLHAERMQVLARERRTRDRFTALHPEVPVAEVAALPGDVHDLAGLRAIGDRLALGPTDPDVRTHPDA
ncbi:ArsA family ATPase [Streptomyces halobius]|uniref:ArsA family ATPase n=1 Tax=Streptomyces halobius TaxID=2879846 RepID=A0ABY4MCL0_9ACTN|nr:ArsA family ATPase [Streptomyces halobius]UQA94061.1 ArsA family ATPase [Streptomyces halobius]